MSRIFIVPETLSQDIYAKVDAQIALHPDSAGDREAFYEQLLSFFDKNGFVPDFTLELKENRLAKSYSWRMSTSRQCWQRN